MSESPAPPSGDGAVAGADRRQGRVTPSATAAAATAWATRYDTDLSNTDGMMNVSQSCSSVTDSAMAFAAASFMFSVMSVARASSAPRKMPGKAKTLLIWFG